MDLWKTAEFLRSNRAEDLGELMLSAGRSGRFRMGGCRWSVMHDIIAGSDGKVSARVLISQETGTARISDSESELGDCIDTIQSAMRGKGYEGGFGDHASPVLDDEPESERIPVRSWGRWDRELLTPRELEIEYGRFSAPSVAGAFGLASPKTLDTMTTIQEVVASSYSLRAEHLRANRQRPALVLPRQLAMYLGIELAMKNAIEVAEWFGSATLADVIQARKKIKALINLDPGFARKVMGMTREVEKSIPTP